MTGEVTVYSYQGLPKTFLLEGQNPKFNSGPLGLKANT